MEQERIQLPAFLMLEDENRIINIRAFINEGIEKDIKFYPKKGYVREEDGEVFVYYEDKKDKPTMLPSFTIEDGKPIYNVGNPKYEGIMNISNIKRVDLEHIINNTSENEELYNEQAISDMNAATSTFVPIINEDDDFLKKLIKKAIIEMNVNIKALQHQMPKKYGLTNMKSALIGSTKMSVTNFLLWCELLGLNFNIIISDNGEKKMVTLNDTLEYDSTVGLIK